MKAQLHTDATIFDELSDEWDSTLDPSRSDTLFMTHRWQRAWWKHLGRGNLALVSVRDDAGTLRGIGPWFIEEVDGKRLVRLVGCIEVVDYLDLIAMPGYEAGVFACLMDFMLSEAAPPWDVMDFCNIPQHSPTRSALPDAASQAGLHVDETVQEVCPVVTLPATYEEYLASLDKKQRHELRRKRRRAEAEDVSWIMADREHDLKADVEDFLDLMAASTPEKAAFLRAPGHRDFFKEIACVTADLGALDLIFLTVKGEKVAAMWQFAYKDRLMLYNSGINDADYGYLSPGIVLLTYSIENAIDRGITHYDFLRGDETYKFRMGAQETTVHNIIINRTL